MTVYTVTLPLPDRRHTPEAVELLNQYGYVTGISWRYETMDFEYIADTPFDLGVSLSRIVEDLSYVDVYPSGDIDVENLTIVPDPRA